MDQIELILNYNLNELLIQVKTIAECSSDALLTKKKIISQIDIKTVINLMSDCLKLLPASGSVLCCKDRILIHNLRNVVEGIDIILSQRMKEMYEKYEKMLNKKEFNINEMQEEIAAASKISLSRRKNPRIEKLNFCMTSGVEGLKSQFNQLHFPNEITITETAPGMSLQETREEFSALQFQEDFTFLNGILGTTAMPDNLRHTMPTVDGTMIGRDPSLEHSRMESLLPLEQHVERELIPINLELPPVVPLSKSSLVVPLEEILLTTHDDYLDLINLQQSKIPETRTGKQNNIYRKHTCFSLKELDLLYKMKPEQQRPFELYSHLQEIEEEEDEFIDINIPTIDFNFVDIEDDDSDDIFIGLLTERLAQRGAREDSTLPSIAEQLIVPELIRREPQFEPEIQRPEQPETERQAAIDLVLGSSQLHQTLVSRIPSLDAQRESYPHEDIPKDISHHSSKSFSPQAKRRRVKPCGIPKENQTIEPPRQLNVDNGIAPSESTKSVSSQSTVGTSESKTEFNSDLLNLVQQLWESNVEQIKFTEICPIQETSRFTAAKTFAALIHFWKKNVILLEQESTDPKLIYVTKP